MDTTETHWSVDSAVHTAVTLVRYGDYRDTLVSRLSCSTAVTLVRYGHYRDTLVSRLSCSTAVTLVRYGHYRDTLVSRLSCTYSSYTGQIRTLQRHTGQSTQLYIQQLHWSDTDTTETHWSVDLAVPQQLHWSDTDITETHWSVDLAVHTAVTLVRYGQYRDTLVSRLSCTTAVTLVRYGHYRDTLVSRLSCTYSSYTGQIRTLQRHTGQST